MVFVYQVCTSRGLANEQVMPDSSLTLGVVADLPPSAIQSSQYWRNGVCGSRNTTYRDVQMGWVDERRARYNEKNTQTHRRDRLSEHIPGTMLCELFIYTGPKKKGTPFEQAEADPTTVDGGLLKERNQDRLFPSTNRALRWTTYRNTLLHEFPATAILVSVYLSISWIGRDGRHR